jgi:uroporphyrinogen decarboxylase
MFVGEPSTSNVVISPRQFETFVLPYVRAINEYALGKGVRHILFHICGEQNKNLEHWAKLPFGDPGILSFGHEVDLTRAIAVFGDRHIIAGNVEPQRIQLSSAAEVYDLTRIAIEKGKRARGGFILMGGCEIPVNAPPYNVWSMRKAVQDHGFYD